MENFLPPLCYIPAKKITQLRILTTSHIFPTLYPYPESEGTICEPRKYNHDILSEQLYE